MELIFEPFKYAFFVRALVIGLLLGLSCGALGCFVVLRGMAFIGDALAHSILPGVVAAYLLGFNIFIGAFIAAIVTALLISGISRAEQIKEDAAIGIVFTGAFALGIVLISRIQGYTRDLAHLMFGNILGVSPDDVTIVIIVTLVVLAAIALWFRDFTLISFDMIHARAIGLKINFLHLLLMILLSLTIVTGLQAVGLILIASMLITPAATARLLTDRLPVMIGLAAGVGCGSALIGLYLSYYMDVASGGAVVLTGTLIFVLAFIFAPKSGYLARRIQMVRQ